MTTPKIPRKKGSKSPIKPLAPERIRKLEPRTDPSEYDRWLGAIFRNAQTLVATREGRLELLLTAQRAAELDPRFAQELHGSITGVVVRQQPFQVFLGSVVKGSGEHGKGRFEVRYEEKRGAWQVWRGAKRLKSGFSSIEAAQNWIVAHPEFRSES